MKDSDISTSVETEIATLQNTTFSNIEIKGLSDYVIRKNNEMHAVEHVRTVAQKH